MLSKGYRLELQPERFPKHKALVKRLLSKPGWSVAEAKVVEPEPPPPEPEEDSDAILPHQQAVIDRLKSFTGADQ